MATGTPVHGDISSANASAGVAFGMGKGGAAFAIPAGAVLHITDLEVIRQDAGNFLVCANTDAAYKRISGGYVQAGAGVSKSFITPYECPAGVTPKLIADTGNIRAAIQGYIRKA